MLLATNQKQQDNRWRQQQLTEEAGRPTLCLAFRRDGHPSHPDGEARLWRRRWLSREGDAGASHVFDASAAKGFSLGKGKVDDKTHEPVPLAFEPVSVILDCPSPSPLPGGCGVGSGVGSDGNGNGGNGGSAKSSGYDTNFQNGPPGRDECETGSNLLLPFRYGGLELTANCKHVEVYLTRHCNSGGGEADKEEYVVTSRGVRERAFAGGIENGEGAGEGDLGGWEGEEWHRFVIVNRGGAATVSRVRIKLLRGMTKSNGGEAEAQRLLWIMRLCVKARLLDADIAAPTASLNDNASANTNAAEASEVTPGLTNVQALHASTIMSAARPGNSATPANIIPPTESLSPPRDSASALINGGGDIPTRSDLGAAIAAARGLLSASEDKVLRAVREALDGIESVDRTRSAVLLDRVEYLAAAEEQRAATEGVNDAVSTEEALALGRVVQSLERRVEQQHEEHMRQMRAIVDTQENLTRMIETLLVRQGEAPPAVKK